MKSNKFLGTIAVGSGSTAPDDTDTELQSLVASVSTSVSAGPSDKTPTDYPWVSAKVTCQFGKGAAAGNLSEIGVGKSATDLLCRTLIKDESGSPTTITITNEEYLSITYYWRIYFDLTYTKTDTFDIEGVTYTTVSMVGYVGTKTAYNWSRNGPMDVNSSCSLAAFTGDVGAPGEAPSGISSYGSTTGKPAGVTGEHASIRSFSLSLNSLNTSNITALSLSRYSGFSGPEDDYMTYIKCSVNPPLTKTSDYTGQIAFKMTWGRYQ